MAKFYTGAPQSPQRFTRNNFLPERPSTALLPTNSSANDDLLSPKPFTLNPLQQMLGPKHFARQCQPLLFARVFPALLQSVRASVAARLISAPVRRVQQLARAALKLLQVCGASSRRVLAQDMREFIDCKAAAASKLQERRPPVATDQPRREDAQARAETKRCVVSLSVRRPRRSLTMSVLRTSNHHRLGTRASSVRTALKRCNAATGWSFGHRKPSTPRWKHRAQRASVRLCPSCFAETSSSTVDLSWCAAAMPDIDDRSGRPRLAADVRFRQRSGLWRRFQVSVMTIVSRAQRHREVGEDGSGLRGLNFCA